MTGIYTTKIAVIYNRTELVTLFHVTKKKKYTNFIHPKLQWKLFWIYGYKEMRPILRVQMASAGQSLPFSLLKKNQGQNKQNKSKKARQILYNLIAEYSCNCGRYARHKIIIKYVLKTEWKTCIVPISFVRDIFCAPSATF